jgi:hypothetical protein
VALTLRSTIASAAGTSRTGRAGWRWASADGVAADPGLSWQPSGIKAAAMSDNPDTMRLTAVKGDMIRSYNGVRFIAKPGTASR